MAGQVWLKRIECLVPTLLPVIFLWVVHLANQEKLSIIAVLIGWLVFLLFIGLCILGLPVRYGRHEIRVPYLAGLIGALAIGSGVIYSLTFLTAAAWIFTSALGLLFLWIEVTLFGEARWIGRLLSSLLFAMMFSCLLVGFWMAESHFSEEEFFVAVQVGVVALLWWLLWLAVILLSRQKLLINPKKLGGFFFHRLIIYPILIIVLLGTYSWMVGRYQASFYPASVDPLILDGSLQNISQQSPFLCKQTNPDGTVYEGREVWRQFLKLVEANPTKSTPEFGMLAVSMGDSKWAKEFHTTILKEAADREFTGPSNSVKIGQYSAALRAYYYSKVLQSFPGLFTANEQREIRVWFAQINRRALTVEWVDWMYGLAFSKMPEGLYENQENGAGLLAILEKNGLSDPSLSSKNRDYLKRNPRGWEVRFRNTDDAITYQPIWLNNAYFQWLYTGKLDSQNQRNSFNWLLYQAPPAGEELQYNHPEPTSLAGAAYLGAVLLKDPHYLWLAGKSVAELAARGGTLEAQPGMEQPVDFDSVSPTVGSCLLYGNSGLPNQAGPLAADKIVLRNGWKDDASYLLLNLRFTGWHRYKGTNTVTLLYQGAALAKDQINGTRVTWLPYGRSQFRDKRIPRENLNGLSIERVGLSAVIHNLTSIGSHWEQDPPFYSFVSDFESGVLYDYARSTIMDWHGWRQDRDLYLTKDGLIVIVDWVQGPTGQGASIFWHLFGHLLSNDKVALGTPPTGAEMIFLTDGQGDLSTHPLDAEINQPNLDVEYRLPDTGKGRLISVFLPKNWAQSQVSLAMKDGQENVIVNRGASMVSLPLKPGGNSQ